MESISIKRIIQETPDTITIVFDLPRGCQWVYEAGQFITLAVTVSGERLYRSYSLAPRSDAMPDPAITIKRVPGGVVSNFLHETASVGSTLACTLPQGTFILPQTPAAVRHMICIAGGSGIVPLLAMLRVHLHRSVLGNATLIYANRNEPLIIYQTQLEQLQKRFASRFRIIHVLSQPAPGWDGYSGRLTPAALLAFTRGLTGTYFLCAPTSMMKMVKETLLARGVPPHRIRQEDFSASPTLAQEDLGMAATVTVLQRGLPHTIQVEKGESLLDAALDAGLNIPSSCCTGICNTCRIRCTKGKVRMACDEGLSEGEKEAGYILSCVGYPATAQVTLDLDDPEE